MEMPSSFRYHNSSTDHHQRRRNPATAHQTLDHHQHICNESTKKTRPTSRDSDQVSATLVSPLRSSYARPFSPPSHLKVRYRECQRNHAASSGGHVIDGCGEFMPDGDDGSPESLRCAACNCHRSFHRRENDGETMLNLHANGHHNMIITTRKVSSHIKQEFRPPQLPPPPLLLHHHVSPIMMSFGGRGPVESSTKDLNKLHQPLSANGIDQFMQPKKRVRTKLSQEQKEKMQEFADKIGWRITKQDEEEIQRFCSQINVKRQVLKVWMHNNKQAARKKQMRDHIYTQNL